MDKELITSVLGFNLKADIRNVEGEIIPAGIKTTIYPAVMMERLNYRIVDKGFFTHYNEALIAKIRDFRRLND